MVNDRVQELGMQVVTEILGMGRQVVLEQADVSTYEGAKQLIDNALREYRHVDGLLVSGLRRLTDEETKKEDYTWQKS